MKHINIVINGINVEVEERTNILQAAQKAGIYIPTLCFHPELPSFKDISPAQSIYQGSVKLEATPGEEYQGCKLCLVDIQGQGIQTSCTTLVSDGMAVQTDTAEIQEARRTNLTAILADHPHECLFCPQHEGCDLQRCSMNTPKEKRCCDKFNTCELRRIAEYIGRPSSIPAYNPKGIPVAEEEPLFRRDYNLCIGCTRCVRACNKLMGAGALGYISVNGKVSVGMLGPSPMDSGCKFCGACAEVCPTGAILDKGIKWAERETALVPCRNTCPAKIDIPGYVTLIAKGKFAEATAVIREKVPFPAVLGRVCFHPCEDACRRGEINDSICIKELKRFAAENDSELPVKDQKTVSQTGKKVAIIGSGPAGLTAGYYLAGLGHAVTVFEALPEPGGMLRVGIPEYRLPRETLDKEITVIKKAGVEIKTNARVEVLDELFSQGYQAVFVASGAHRGTRLGIEGEDSPGVIEGVSLLRDVGLNRGIQLGERIAVVGGGNVAIDSARTALRLGAKEVTVIYRRSRAEMPASPEEIEEATNEGVQINFLVNPSKIARKNGKLAVTCFRMELAEPDASGRRKAVAVKDSQFTKEFDNIILAIGQVPEIPEKFNLTLNKGTFQANPETLETSARGIFAGGDAVSGPASVIEAIAMGRKAAASIDHFLGGSGTLDQPFTEPVKADLWVGREEGFGRRKKALAPALSISERKGNFKEVVLSYERSKAIQEASRCLRCNLRLGISATAVPPKKWLEFNAENIEKVPEKEGVCELFDKDSLVIYIKGSMNLREELRQQLNNDVKAKYFTCEEEGMFTQRENELLQKYLQEHGSLPPINIGGDLEDLF
jgi:formate dehydrogenase (NADP+) beta subunit